MSQGENPESSRQRLVFVSTLLVALAGLLWGAHAFWFLCDDAYITFRYASNAQAGRGYVWNPEPFLPVEGYTSFLWLVILDQIWSLFGIEPPDSANPLLIACGALTLGRVAFFTWSRGWMRRLSLPHRAGFLALLLAGILSNTTFLAWLTSGLETALFNFLVCSWLLDGWDGVRLGRTSTLARFVSWAALLPLVRPEGLGFAISCAGVLTLQALSQRRWVKLVGAGLAVIPLLLHLVWRRGFYGEWLPNTYYAKHLGSWPSAGVRYLESFIWEYAVWASALLLLSAFLFKLRAGALPKRPFSKALERLGIWGTPLSILLYYTFEIGGDHFEYRIYSVAIPFLWLLTIWAGASGAWRPQVGLAAVGVCLALSLPLSWAEHFAAQRASHRDKAVLLHVKIAEDVVVPFRPLASRLDTLQGWLSARMIGLRRQEHRLLWLASQERFPGREEGEKISWRDRRVGTLGTVGYIGWVFPNVAIVDGLGLTDWVVARAPYQENEKGHRHMAHSRNPPFGYIECLRPNFKYIPGRGYVIEKTPPLKDAEIRLCEARYRDQVRNSP